MISAAAQGRAGRNGQTFSTIATSNNTNVTNVSEVCSIHLQVCQKVWYVFRDPQGAQGRPPFQPKQAIFGGLPWTPLKTPEPPYPFKLLCYSTSQTYDRLKLIALSEVWFLEIGCPFRPFLPWAVGKSLQLSITCFINFFFNFFYELCYMMSEVSISSPAQMTS